MRTFSAFLRELFRSLLVFLLASAIIYALIVYSPGARHRSSEQRGEDKVSSTLAYFTWVKNLILYRDLGETTIGGKEVLSELISKGKNSLFMIGFALISSGLLSLMFIGLSSRLSRLSLLPATTKVLPYLLSALPAFIVGAFLIHRFPGLKYPFSQFKEVPVWPYYLVPACILGIADGFLSEMIRYAKEEIEKAAGENYLLLAKAKGARLWSHLKYDFITHISQLVFSKVALLISGTVILEYMFSLPGIGALAFTAAEGHDMNLLLGTLVLLVFFVILFNFFNRLILVAIDPRVR